MFDEKTGKGHTTQSHQPYDIYNYFTEPYLLNEKARGYDNKWVEQGIIYTNPLHRDFSATDAETILARVLRFVLSIRDDQVKHRSFGEKMGWGTVA